MEQGRIHWYLPDELNEHQRDFYNRLTAGPRAHEGRGLAGLVDSEGRLQGPFNMLLLDPTLGTAYQELGAAVRFNISLPQRALEICILEVARREQCNVEWPGHANRARRLGVTDEDIEAILTGQPAPNLTDEEQLIRRVINEILCTRDLSGDLFEEAKTILGLTTIFHIVAIVGYYQFLALSLRIWQVPPRAGVEPVFPIK